VGKRDTPLRPLDQSARCGQWSGRLQAALTAAAPGGGGRLRARLRVVRHPHCAALGRPVLLQPGDRLLKRQRGAPADAGAVRAGGRRRGGRLRRGSGRRGRALRHACSRAALQVRAPPAPGRVSAPACRFILFGLTMTRHCNTRDTRRLFSYACSTSLAYA